MHARSVYAKEISAGIPRVSRAAADCAAAWFTGSLPSAFYLRMHLKQVGCAGSRAWAAPMVPHQTPRSLVLVDKTRAPQNGQYLFHLSPVYGEGFLRKQYFGNNRPLNEICHR